MKLYIAGHNQEEARAVAKLCVEAGHEITSRWLEEDFSKSPQYTETDKTGIASVDVEDVHLADALVMIPSPRRIPGGKFVEAGVAIGTNKRVFVLGHRENMLMWHPLVSAWASVEDFLKSNCAADETADETSGRSAYNADVDARRDKTPNPTDG
jgi:nucleoside 2-deoxyribosyltransferase